ncbi:MAG: ComF family protein [Candidatus Kapaibacterium sp.]
MIRTISRRVAHFFEPFLDVCAPRICAICERHPAQSVQPHDHRTSDGRAYGSDYLCNRCLDRLPIAPAPEFILDDLVQRFPGDDLAIDTVRSCFAARARDDKGLMGLIHLLKYGGIPHIGVDLGRILGDRGLVHPVDADLLVPVPVHAARRRERGYNQAERIASGITDVLGIPTVDDAVRRTRYRRSQTSLRGTSRESNVDGVFGPGPAAHQLRDRSVVLIDDVLTTGSTLNALAHCALDCGARTVHAMTVVRAT